MTWQPIETAPRDGTEIVGWWNDDSTTTVFWAAERWININGYQPIVAPDLWCFLPKNMSRHAGQLKRRHSTKLRAIE